MLWPLLKLMREFQRLKLSPAQMQTQILRAAQNQNLNLAIGLQIGAFMNNTFQATDGLNADLFPQNIPTFTGHYHRPHTVGDTSIRYVGSPYQGAWTHLSCSSEAEVV